MTTKKSMVVDDDGCQIRVVHMDRVDQARKAAIPGAELDRLVLTYKVLGDSTRLKIVMALRDVEMCVCDLAAFLGVSASAVSHQLRRLKDLSLVKSRRDGIDQQNNTQNHQGQGYPHPRHIGSVTMKPGE